MARIQGKSTGRFGKLGWPGKSAKTSATCLANAPSRKTILARTLQGCRVLITGASSGIGRCLAEQLAREGARVGATARPQDALAGLGRESTSRGEVVPIAGDVTHDGDRRRMLDTTVAKLGGLDVLVNNAGIASWAHFADSSEEILRQIMEVNFFAPAELIRLAIPH